MRSAGNGFECQPAEAAMSRPFLVAQIKDQLDPPVLRAAGQGVVRGNEAARTVGVSLGWVLSRWSRTASARARASDSLKASGPVLSVRPTIMIWRAESRVLIAPFRLERAAGLSFALPRSNWTMIVREVSILGVGSGGIASEGMDWADEEGAAPLIVRTEESVARVFGVRVGQAGGTQCPKAAWRPKSSCASCQGAASPVFFG